MLTVPGTDATMKLKHLYNERKRGRTMKKKNLLAELPLFQGASIHTLEELWRKGKVESFPKGIILVRAREPLQTVYVQLAGKSIIYNLTHTGKRKIIFVLGPGALLNEHVLNFHDASLFCETIEASRIYVIPCSWFLDAMEKDFGLARAVLEAQERKLWRMGHQLKNTMGSIYIERKLAAKLWKLSRDFGKVTPEGIEIDIRLTITFLADMLGAPRETTSRLCKNLCEAGLIRMDRRRIVIINPEKLSHFYKTGQV